MCARFIGPKIEILLFEEVKRLLKVKGSVLLLMEPHITATGCHLPYWITQCYLPPDVSEHILH